jgi:Cellulase (glycosyl hydrolase family 5)
MTVPAPPGQPAAVPRGVTVTGLASLHWRSGDGDPLGQIQHAHDDWFANTVRLQVGVPLLRGKTNATTAWHGGGPVPALTEYLATPGNGMTGQLNGNHYNADFLGYLDQAVGLAQQLGLTVVICAQHEGLDNTAMPAGNDVAFWKIIHDHYGPGVVCDLFNEPEPGAVYSDMWLGWQGGGPGSDGVSYTGFQAMVSELREYGVKGTFWVEGAAHAATLEGVADGAGNFQLSDPLDNIVYAIHHPQGARTPANWTTQFGYLAGLGIPVVVGEWTNWATNNPECWPDAASTVPAFLDYVTGLGTCGLIVWALLPRVLVVDQRDWVPTQILASYACDGSVAGQGAGALIQAQFAAWAGQPVPAPPGPATPAPSPATPATPGDPLPG